jgi:hypothetical protein
MIFLIWLYGFIITKAQTKASNKKKEKSNVKVKRETEKVTKPPVDKKPAVKPQKDGLSDEIVAVISAAVYSMYGSTEKVKIKSIKRSGASSAWKNAGVLNNTRPF